MDIPFLLKFRTLETNCSDKTSKWKNIYDQIGLSVLYQIILILKACEKSADFYNAKTCSFSTGPLFEGLTHIHNYMYTCLAFLKTFFTVCGKVITLNHETMKLFS